MNPSLQLKDDRISLTHILQSQEYWISEPDDGHNSFLREQLSDQLKHLATQLLTEEYGDTETATRTGRIFQSDSHDNGTRVPGETGIQSGGNRANADTDLLSSGSHPKTDARSGSGCSYGRMKCWHNSTGRL